jgi:hypothetical protein
MKKFPKFHEWFTLQKIRYDMAAGYDAILLFAVFILGMKSNIPFLARVPSLAIIAAAIIGRWCFGFVLDRLKTQQKADKIMSERSVSYQALKEQTERIEQMLIQMQS